MSSSPTSSHTDYMPATSSATVVVAAVTPQQISSNTAESSSQSQELDQNVVSAEGSIQIVVTGGQQGSFKIESLNIINYFLTLSNKKKGQQTQQAVALVSPRIENQPTQNVQSFESQTPSTSGSHSSMVS